MALIQLSRFGTVYLLSLPEFHFGGGGFLGGSHGKESACNAGDQGLIPGMGRSPGEGKGNPLQCSSPENPTGRGAWQAQSMEVQQVGCG